MPDISILGIIRCKLSHWQKSYLVILFKVDKDLRVYFYYPILIFGLVVSL